MSPRRAATASAEPEARDLAEDPTADAATVRAPATVPSTLHLPDEPAGRRRAWFEAVLDGVPLEEVIGGDGGIAPWLWSRWRVLESAGIDEDGLRAITLGYRRELWLWLVGDRSWQQCCSGLIGRIGRRSG